MRLIVFLLSLITCQVFASIPTVEGLFRNGSNKEPTGNLIVLKIMIQSVEDNVYLMKKSVGSNEELLSQSVASEAPVTKFIKYLIEYEDEKPVGVLQVTYSDGSMQEDKIEDVVFFQTFFESLKSDTYTERSLFYSLLMMLTLNESGPLSELFKKIERSYKASRDLINTDKQKLLNDYKDYLVSIKNDESLAESLPKPFEPETAEEKERVDSIRKSRMYMVDPSVKLIRSNNSFYWHVNFDSLKARFTNEKHQLRNLELNTISGNVKYDFGEYILFDGIHELPKVIFIKDVNDKLFKLQTLSLRHLNSKTKSLSQRAEEYLKLLTKAKNSKVKVKEDTETVQPQQINFLY